MINTIEMSNEINEDEIKEIKEIKEKAESINIIGNGQIKTLDDIINNNTLGKRDIKEFDAEIKKQSESITKLFRDFHVYISDMKHQDDIKKLEKKKSKSKASKDDNKSEDSDNKKDYAVNKVSECHEFVSKFMETYNKETYNEENNYSPTAIQAAMNQWVKNEKETNKDKISKGMPDGRSFNVYGDLEKFIKDLIKVGKEDKKIIDNDIKMKEKSKPIEGSKEEKLISNLQFSRDKLDALLTVPTSMRYTDIMSYKTFCFKDRDVLGKASKNHPIKKVKEV